MVKLKLFNTVALYKQITIWDKGQKEDLIILQSKKMQEGWGELWQANKLPWSTSFVTCSLSTTFCSPAHFNNASTLLQMHYFKMFFLSLKRDIHLALRK